MNATESQNRGEDVEEEQEEEKEWRTHTRDAQSPRVEDQNIWKEKIR